MECLLHGLCQRLLLTFTMLLPSQIRLIAAILALLMVGWYAKQYREQAHAEPLKAKVRARR